MKKRIVFVLVIVGLLIIAAFGIPHLLETRTAHTKSSFTDEQVKIIAEKLDIASEDLSVEKIEYTNYKSKGNRVIQFRIFGTLNRIDSVEKSYRLDKSLGDNKEIKYYTNRTDENISCDVTQLNNSSSYEVYFRINEEDQELDDMM